MHIAVNTRLLLPGKLDGIGWFSHEVLSRLVKDLPEWRFTFLFDRPFDQRFIYGGNVEGQVLFPPTRHPLLYQLYFQRSLPHKLKRLKPDLFFSPDGFLSTRTSVPQVPVIHDLNFEHRPGDLPSAYSNYYRTWFPRFAHRAAHILTVSQFSATDIADSYGIDEGRITVAHNGYHPGYRPLDEADKQAARTRLSGGKPYFIFVGNFSFRKNIHGILRAYDTYRKLGGSHRLMLVGNPMWKYAEMEAALNASPYQTDVLMPGRLDLEDLSAAVASAEAMIFPSYFEGFGIPVLEAFACGTPVITSNVTSLPEISGDAALLFSPDDVNKIGEAMLGITKDETLRNQLVEKGLQRVQKFSWNNTANKVKSVLFDCVG